MNLLRNLRLNPNLSSWALINENHDFNCHPLVPPGTKIIIHSKPSNRPSWAFYGHMGWYIGPAPSHYRCVKCFVPQTRSEIISDRVKFIPHHIPIPSANIDEHICHSFNVLIFLLNTRKTIFPGLISNPNSTSTLLQLSDILHGRSSNTQQSSSQRTSEGEKTRPVMLPEIKKVQPIRKKFTNEEFKKI